MIKKENSGEVGEDLGNIQTGLSPIIKWAGGKEKELKYIIPNLPKFGRFFEPFVGGGSVFMGIKSREIYHIFLCLTQYKYTKFILHKQTLTHKLYTKSEFIHQ